MITIKVKLTKDDERAFIFKSISKYKIGSHAGKVQLTGTTINGVKVSLRGITRIEILS